MNLIFRAMYYAIFTPSNNASNAPSMKFAPKGYLSEKEAAQIDQQLAGTLCELKAWKSEEDFKQDMNERDDLFYRNRPTMDDLRF